MEPITPGRTAYEAYFKKCGGKLLISGVPLPSYDQQSEAIRAAWETAGEAVLGDRRLDAYRMAIRGGDPVCGTCGERRSEHNMRHPFVAVGDGTAS